MNIILIIIVLLVALSAIGAFYYFFIYESQIQKIAKKNNIQLKKELWKASKPIPVVEDSQNPGFYKVTFDKLTNVQYSDLDSILEKTHGPFFIITDGQAYFGEREETTTELDKLTITQWLQKVQIFPVSNNKLFSGFYEAVKK